MTTATKRRPAKRTRRTERANRVAELSAKLKAYADSLDPQKRAAYEGRFDHYSPRNGLLIVMQRPDATVVRGYEAWTKEGRQVRKGEHGIQILAPAGTYTVEVDQPAGSPDGDTKTEVSRQRFRIAYVFDITQTDPVDEGESDRHDATQDR